MKIRTFVLASMFLAACGDDGGSTPIDSAPPIDQVTVDSAPACGFAATLPAGSIGSMAQRQAGDWVRTQNNTTTFGIQIGLEQPVNGAANTMLITYVKPQGGFVLNQALPFETNPMGTGAVNIILFEKLNAQAQTYTRVLFPSNGSITFTMLGETANSPTTATVTATNFREINDSTGADVPGGCTSQLAGLSMYLTESTAVAREGSSGRFDVSAAELAR